MGILDNLEDTRKDPLARKDLYIQSKKSLENLFGTNAEKVRQYLPEGVDVEITDGGLRFTYANPSDFRGQQKNLNLRVGRNEANQIFFSMVGPSENPVVWAPSYYLAPEKSQVAKYAQETGSLQNIFTGSYRRSSDATDVRYGVYTPTPARFAAMVGSGVSDVSKLLSGEHVDPTSGIRVAPTTAYSSATPSRAEIVKSARYGSLIATGFEKGESNAAIRSFVHSVYAGNIPNAGVINAKTGFTNMGNDVIIGLAPSSHVLIGKGENKTLLQIAKEKNVSIATGNRMGLYAAGKVGAGGRIEEIIRPVETADYDPSQAIVKNKYKRATNRISLPEKYSGKVFRPAYGRTMGMEDEFGTVELVSYVGNVDIYGGGARVSPNSPLANIAGFTMSNKRISSMSNLGYSDLIDENNQLRFSFDRNLGRVFGNIMPTRKNVKIGRYGDQDINFNIDMKAGAFAINKMKINIPRYLAYETDENGRRIVFSQKDTGITTENLQKQIVSQLQSTFGERWSDYVTISNEGDKFDIFVEQLKQVGLSPKAEISKAGMEIGHNLVVQRVGRQRMEINPTMVTGAIKSPFGWVNQYLKLSPTRGKEFLETFLPEEDTDWLRENNLAGVFDWKKMRKLLAESSNVNLDSLVLGSIADDVTIDGRKGMSADPTLVRALVAQEIANRVIANPEKAAEFGIYYDPKAEVMVSQKATAANIAARYLAPMLMQSDVVMANQEFVKSGGLLDVLTRSVQSLTPEETTLGSGKFGSLFKRKFLSNLNQYIKETGTDIQNKKELVAAVGELANTMRIEPSIIDRRRKIDFSEQLFDFYKQLPVLTVPQYQRPSIEYQGGVSLNAVNIAAIRAMSPEFAEFLGVTSGADVLDSSAALGGMNYAAKRLSMIYNLNRATNTTGEKLILGPSKNDYVVNDKKTVEALMGLLPDENTNRADYGSAFMARVNELIITPESELGENARLARDILFSRKPLYLGNTGLRFPNAGDVHQMMLMNMAGDDTTYLSTIYANNLKDILNVLSSENYTDIERRDAIEQILNSPGGGAGSRVGLMYKLGNIIEGSGDIGKSIFGLSNVPFGFSGKYAPLEVLDIDEAIVSDRVLVSRLKDMGLSGKEISEFYNTQNYITSAFFRYPQTEAEAMFVGRVYTPALIRKQAQRLRQKGADSWTEEERDFMDRIADFDSRNRGILNRIGVDTVLVSPQMSIASRGDQDKDPLGIVFGMRVGQDGLEYASAPTYLQRKQIQRRFIEETFGKNAADLSGVIDGAKLGGRVKVVDPASAAETLVDTAVSKGLAGVAYNTRYALMAQHLLNGMSEREAFSITSNLLGEYQQAIDLKKKAPRKFESLIRASKLLPAFDPTSGEERTIGIDNEYLLPNLYAVGNGVMMMNQDQRQTGTYSKLGGGINQSGNLMETSKWIIRTALSEQEVSAEAAVAMLATGKESATRISEIIQQKGWDKFERKSTIESIISYLDEQAGGSYEDFRKRKEEFAKYGAKLSFNPSQELFDIKIPLVGATLANAIEKGVQALQNPNETSSLKKAGVSAMSEEKAREVMNRVVLGKAPDGRYITAGDISEFSRASSGATKAILNKNVSFAEAEAMSNLFPQTYKRLMPVPFDQYKGQESKTYNAMLAMEAKERIASMKTRLLEGENELGFGARDIANLATFSKNNPRRGINYKTTLNYVLSNMLFDDKRNAREFRNLALENLESQFKESVLAGSIIQQALTTKEGYNYLQGKLGVKEFADYEKAEKMNKSGRVERLVAEFNVGGKKISVNAIPDIIRLDTENNSIQLFELKAGKQEKFHEKQLAVTAEALRQEIERAKGQDSGLSGTFANILKIQDEMAGREVRSKEEYIAKAQEFIDKFSGNITGQLLYVSPGNTGGTIDNPEGPIVRHAIENPEKYFEKTRDFGYIPSGLFMKDLDDETAKGVISHLGKVFYSNVDVSEQAAKKVVREGVQNLAENMNTGFVGEAIGHATNERANTEKMVKKAYAKMESGVPLTNAEKLTLATFSPEGFKLVNYAQDVNDPNAIERHRKFIPIAQQGLERLEKLGGGIAKKPISAVVPKSISATGRQWPIMTGGGGSGRKPPKPPAQPESMPAPQGGWQGGGNSNVGGFDNELLGQLAGMLQQITTYGVQMQFNFPMTAENANKLIADVGQFFGGGDYLAGFANIRSRFEGFSHSLRNLGIDVDATNLQPLVLASLIAPRDGQNGQFFAGIRSAVGQHFGDLSKKQMDIIAKLPRLSEKIAMLSDVMARQETKGFEEFAFVNKTLANIAPMARAVGSLRGVVSDDMAEQLKEISDIKGVMAQAFGKEVSINVAGAEYKGNPLMVFSKLREKLRETPKDAPEREEISKAMLQFSQYSELIEVARADYGMSYADIARAAGVPDDQKFGAATVRQIEKINKVAVQKEQQEKKRQEEFNLYKQKLEEKHKTFKKQSRIRRNEMKLKSNLDQQVIDAKRKAQESIIKTEQEAKQEIIQQKAIAEIATTKAEEEKEIAEINAKAVAEIAEIQAKQQRDTAKAEAEVKKLQERQKLTDKQTTLEQTKNTGVDKRITLTQQQTTLTEKQTTLSEKRTVEAERKRQLSMQQYATWLAKAANRQAQQQARQQRQAQQQNPAQRQQRIQMQAQNMRMGLSSQEQEFVQTLQQDDLQMMLDAINAAQGANLGYQLQNQLSLQSSPEEIYREYKKATKVMQRKKDLYESDTQTLVQSAIDAKQQMQTRQQQKQTQQQQMAADVTNAIDKVANAFGGLGQALDFINKTSSSAANNLKDLGDMIKEMDLSIKENTRSQLEAELKSRIPQLESIHQQLSTPGAQITDQQRKEYMKFISETQGMFGEFLDLSMGIAKGRRGFDAGGFFREMLGGFGLMYISRLVGMGNEFFQMGRKESDALRAYSRAAEGKYRLGIDQYVSPDQILSDRVSLAGGGFSRQWSRMTQGLIGGETGDLAGIAATGIGFGVLSNFISGHLSRNAGGNLLAKGLAGFMSGPGAIAIGIGAAAFTGISALVGYANDNEGTQKQIAYDYAKNMYKNKDSLRTIAESFELYSKPEKDRQTALINEVASLYGLTEEQKKFLLYQDKVDVSYHKWMHEFPKELRGISTVSELNAAIANKLRQQGTTLDKFTKEQMWAMQGMLLAENEGRYTSEQIAIALTMGKYYGISSNEIQNLFPLARNPEFADAIANAISSLGVISAKPFDRKEQYRILEKYIASVGAENITESKLEQITTIANLANRNEYIRRYYSERMSKYGVSGVIDRYGAMAVDVQSSQVSPLYEADLEELAFRVSKGEISEEQFRTSADRLLYDYSKKAKEGYIPTVEELRRAAIKQAVPQTLKDNATKTQLQMALLGRSEQEQEAYRKAYLGMSPLRAQAFFGTGMNVDVARGIITNAGMGDLGSIAQMAISQGFAMDFSGAGMAGFMGIGRMQGTYDAAGNYTPGRMYFGSNPLQFSLTSAKYTDPRSFAAAVWGQNWANNAHLRAMVNGYTVTATGGQSYTFAGLTGGNFYMMDEAYRAQMASIGIQAKSLALQKAFTTGIGISAYAGAINPQTGRPFNFNTGTFSVNLGQYGSYTSVGGGFWGLEDANRNFGYLQQQFSLDMQAKQMQMQRNQFMENYSLNWTQSRMQRGWTMQDWNYQDMTRNLQWGWRLEDYQENIRFTTGRERRLAERQMRREATMFGIEGEQIDKQRERQKEIWKLEDERFRLTKKHFEEQMKMQEENHNFAIKSFEERKKLEEQQVSLQRAYQVEQWKLQEASIGASARHAQIVYETQKNLEILQALQDQASSDAISYAETFWDLNKRKILELIALLGGSLKDSGLGRGGAGYGNGNNRFGGYDPTEETIIPRGTNGTSTNSTQTIVVNIGNEKLGKFIGENIKSVLVQ